MIGWELVYEQYDAAHEGEREALCTLGNGYFATRGAAPETDADGVHYPGTYVAGCYNRLETTISGRRLENEDLVNVPNWLPLTFRVEGGAWFHIDRFEILSYRQQLDLARGVLMREVCVRDPQGRRTRVNSRRIVHMAAPHLAAIETTIRAENWSGRVEIRSALDGRVRNRNVARHRLLADQHLVSGTARAIGEDTVLLAVRTVQSDIAIAQAARTRVFDGDQPYPCVRRTDVEDMYIAQELVLELSEGRAVTIEKTVALHTSRDHAISECRQAASDAVCLAPGFTELLASHALAWAQLWRTFDITLEAVEPAHPELVETGVSLRLDVFHLLQTASPHTIDLDVGVGARGLHGEAYRGHVFWDELLIFPLLTFRMPEITRGLLKYRHRRLDAARRAARTAGFRGAMFPWQSGSDGREETPQSYFNPRSGRWITDYTYLQRHVGAAIAYNVWQYYQATGDVEFFDGAGAELVLEIARFFASLATYNAASDRFEIRGVMGPDEYHTGYPGSDRPGVDNNTYTNVMAVWVLCRALDILALLPRDRRRELCERLAIGSDEIAAWDRISRRMRVVFLADQIPAQFEGYERLEELDTDRYRARYGSLYRLDFILEAEGDSPNRYKMSKQADVLMLFYLFSADELRALFARLGYPFDPAAIPRTIDYYLRRTSEGSTLSRVAHAWVLARSDRHGSWRVFRDALTADVSDIEDGTTREGIHLGAMAGAVDVVQRCYTGLELRDDVLWLNPRLPEVVSRLALLVRYRTHTLELEISHDALVVNAARCEIPSMSVGVRGQIYEIAAGERRVFSLTETHPSESPEAVGSPTERRGT